MKTTLHVDKFVSLFSVVENRLGNEALRLSDSEGNPLPGVDLEAFYAFVGGQVERDGEGDKSTVDKEVLDILIKHYEGKVDSLDAEANSSALLKRANGWHKRPEKVAASGELRTRNNALETQKQEGERLVLLVSEAENEHGKGSEEYAKAQDALQTYMMANIGK